MEKFDPQYILILPQTQYIKSIDCGQIANKGYGDIVHGQLENSKNEPFTKESKKNNDEKIKKNNDEKLEKKEYSFEKIQSIYKDNKCGLIDDEKNLKFWTFIWILLTAREIIYNDSMKKQFIIQKDRSDYYNEEFKKFLEEEEVSFDQIDREYREQIKYLKCMNRIRNGVVYGKDQDKHSQNVKSIINKTISFCEYDFNKFIHSIKQNEKLRKDQQKIIIDFVREKQDLTFNETFGNMGQFLHMVNELFKIKKDIRTTEDVLQNIKNFILKAPKFIRILEVIFKYAKKKEFKIYGQYDEIKNLPNFGGIYEQVIEELENWYKLEEKEKSLPDMLAKLSVSEKKRF